MIPIPSKLYLYGGLALALLIGVAVIYKRGVDSGKAAQKEEMVADAKVQMEEVRKAAEAEFQRITTASEQAIQQAQAARVASERRESSLVAALASISQQRQTANQAVSRVVDSQLRPEIVRVLGIRDIQDSSPNYLPSEERKILETLTDYPLLKQQNQAIQAQVTEIREQVASLRQEVTGVERKAEAERQLRVKYSELYTQSYNLLRQKKRSPKCLWLFRCSREPLLNLPNPDALSRVGSTQTVP